MPYTRTTWVDESTPAIDAANLNNIETGVVAAPYGPDASSGWFPVANGSGGWAYRALQAADIPTLTPAKSGLPKITTSAMSGGPPGSPADGDIWIATTVDANGTRWGFQYNAGSVSSSKWEFIGGSPVVIGGGSGALTIGVDGSPATPGATFSIPRAGDYVLSGTAEFSITPNAGTAVYYIATEIAAWSVYGETHLTMLNSGGAQQYTLPVFPGVVTLAAATVVQQKYQVNTAASASVSVAKAHVIPVRVA